MTRAPHKKKPRHPAKARKLEAWQRVMFEAVTRPLDADFNAQRRWRDGRPAKKVLAALIKPSATLEPIERVEIYNRMYWYRMLDGLAEDFPGLRAFLGAKRFDALCAAYMVAYPSKSYTLRNVGSRLAKYLRGLSLKAFPLRDAAVDLALYEWAQVEAFDGGHSEVLSPASLSPRARLALQPYVTLVRVHHPVDEFVYAVKNDGVLKTGASNTLTRRSAKTKTKARTLERSAPLDIAVHRYEGRLYFKRLDPRAARLLRALQKGETLAGACALAMRGSRDSAEQQTALVQTWFTQWFGLGWLCKPDRK